MPLLPPAATPASPWREAHLMGLLDRGELREAIGALDHPRPADGPPSLATLQGLLQAWVDAARGQTAAAAASAAALVRRLDAAGGGPLLGHALVALGSCSVMAGHLEAGVPQLERALSLPLAAGPRAQALRYLGQALERQGAWEGAAARYREAAAIYAQLQVPQGLGSARYGAAEALSEVGDLDGARAEATAAVEALRAAPPGPALGAALAMLATLIAPEDTARATALLEEAEHLQSAAQGMWRADLLLRRATVAILDNALPKALVDVEQAIAACPDDNPLRLQGLHLWARVQLKVGAAGAAWEVLQAPIEESAPPQVVEERHCLRAWAAAATGRWPDLAAAIESLRASAPRWRLPWRTLPLLAAVEASLQAGQADAAAQALAVALARGAPAAHLLPAVVAAGAPARIGPLRLVDRIGGGGMGEVWRAIHRDGAAVAVKILLRDDLSPRHAALRVALFQAELSAQATLDHPGVMRILAALPVDPVAAAILGRAPGSLALVMELADGGSLDRSPPPADWPSARRLLAGLLAGLAHAHARGVLHLDIKPGNVLWDDGAPRLTDFGLSGLRVGGAGGTPAFMAPEQAQPGAPVGPAADLYGLGATAWQLLTGAPPPAGPRPALRPRFAVPKGLDDWLAGLLAPWPADRFACAADALAALDALGERCDGGDEGGPALFVSSPALTLALSGLFSRPPDSTRSPSIAALPPASPAWPPPEADPTHLTTLGPDRPAPPSLSPLTTARPGAVHPTQTPLDPFPDPEPIAPTAGRVHPRRPCPAEAPAPPAHRPLPFLSGAGEGLFAARRGRLVGRGAARAQLWSALARVDASGGCAVVQLIGPAGVGRSALLRWLGETAAEVGAARVLHSGDHPDLEGALQALLADRPALLLLDDLPAAQAKRLAVCATGRAALLVWTGREATPVGGEVVELGPLDDGEIMALLNERLPIAPALQVRLAARAAGSPAFALALLQALVAADALAPGPHGHVLRGGVPITLPADLAGLWTLRVDALAPPGSPRRAGLELLALLGAAAPIATWRACAARLGWEADLSDLEPFVAEGWLTVDAGSARFLLPALREALVSTPRDPARAAAWHAAAAATLRDAGAPARKWAPHLARAGRHAEALRPLRSAAADAVNALRLEECRALLADWERSADSLGLRPDDPQRAHPLVVRAHLARLEGKDPAPLVDQGLRLTAGVDPSLEAQLLLALAWSREGANAVALFERASTLARVAGDLQLLAIAAVGLVRACHADPDGDDRAARKALAKAGPNLQLRLGPYLELAVARRLLASGARREGLDRLALAQQAARDADALEVLAEVNLLFAEELAAAGDEAAARVSRQVAALALAGTGLRQVPGIGITSSLRGTLD